jgi:hypothetical protein
LFLLIRSGTAKLLFDGPVTVTLMYELRGAVEKHAGEIEIADP